MIDNDEWNKYTVLKPILKYSEIGLSKKMVERKLATAYLKFYTRPKYLLKHRYMIKVMLQTVLRSFIIPKLTGGNGKGWYQNLDNENSSK